MASLHQGRGGAVDRSRCPAAERIATPARCAITATPRGCVLLSGGSFWRAKQPNGFQNFLRRDDSDNWIHWDFNLKAGDVDLHFAGTSRDIHVIVSEALTDEHWKALILAIKEDYRRVGKRKSDVQRGLEKYVVFQNKYVSLASLCADLHAQIVDAPPYEPLPKGSSAYEADPEAFKQAMDRVSERADKLYGNCLKLRLLTPIMAEAFINMTILMFCKNAIRDDEASYQEFVRAKIPERLALLSKNCVGFARGIDTGTDAYASFMRVIDKRNFALHGNVDPVKEQIEVVYFDGRRPLFSEPGHNVERFFEHLEAINRPQEVVKDYEEMHGFLSEIADCLEPKTRAFFDQVIDDAYPGYEVRKRRATRILRITLPRGLCRERATTTSLPSNGDFELSLLGGLFLLCSFRHAGL
jgi:hypothetical protein